MFPKISVSMLLLAMCIVLAITNSGEAAYRKPPFNGSIFGKRSGNNIDYDSNGKALTAMCEIAIEACQSWFPQDKK